MITIRGVTKRYTAHGAPALDDLDLDVRDGEVLGLVGLNGAGKTTAIRIATGLMTPTRGSVEIDGADLVARKTDASQSVGWVPETYPFDPSARALSLLRFYAGFNGLPRAEARERAVEVLREVGLARVERQRIRTFSQGMRRRFGIAAAMLSDPRNLLLDEVLNGLDPEGIAFVRTWVLAQRERQRAILLSSHLLGELEAVADRVAFLHHGRLLRTATRSELRSAAAPILRVTLENPDAASLAYLRGLGSVREEGTTCVVTGATAPSAEVNAELVRRGYRVQEIRLDHGSLESYFFRLLEEEG